MTTHLLKTDPLPHGILNSLSRWFYNSIDYLEQEALTRIAPDGSLTTLDEIGKRYGLTRERVRQRQKKAQLTLLGELSRLAPSWLSHLTAELNEQLVVRFEEVAKLFGGDTLGHASTLALLSTLKWRCVQPDGGWWAPDKGAVSAALRTLSLDGPITEDEWAEMVTRCALPAAFLDSAKIPGVGQWVQFREHRVGSRRARAEKSVVVLRELGGLSLDELASEIDDAVPRSLDNLLARDDRFVRVPKVGWNLAEAIDAPVYNSTLPAVIDVLRSRGPLTRRDLYRAVIAIHPVTPGRVEQMLDNYQIGFMPDGRVGLVEFGATRPVETEPERPDNMVAVNDTIGIRIRLNHDHMRGSGFAYNTWLVWKLGLRSTPDSVTFLPADTAFDETVVVTRRSAFSSFSSIRMIAEKHGCVEGCDAVLTLDTAQKIWAFTHVCTPTECPARNGVGPST